MNYHPKPYNGKHGHIKPRPSLPCQCADHACPAHLGADCTATMPIRDAKRLFRIDMDDYTGTRFCPACYDDAYASGLFSA